MSEAAVWDELTRFEQRALIKLFGGGSLRDNSPAVADELRARGMVDGNDALAMPGLLRFDACNSPPASRSTNARRARGVIVDLRKNDLQTFQTSDLVEARRCRRAQFAGRISTVQVSGTSVTGLVHSVLEEPFTAPAQSTIKIVPKDLPKFKPLRRPSI